MKDHWKKACIIAQEEVEKIRERLLKLNTTQAEWNHIDEILEKIKRTTEERNQTQKESTRSSSSTGNRNNSNNNESSINLQRILTCSITSKRKKNRRFKRKKMVINLSTYQLKREEISLLEKGLNFIPTPQIEHQAKIVQDFLLYERKCRLYHRFHKEDENDKDEEDVVEEEDELSQNILKVNKGWTPHDNLTDPNILAYKSVCLHNLKKNMNSKIKPRFNLKKKERQAIRILNKNSKIVIKPADKGGAIVIMNKEDYREEGMRQLKKTEHYRKLENQKSEIKNFINTVKEDLDMTVRKGLISKEMRNMLYRDNPRTSNLYLLPKIHKANNPGRPIINFIGSITEPLSAYVDQILRKYLKKCESYIKDTSHFLNIVKDIKTEEGAILCTIDVSALYTNIPHEEGISRCDKQLEKLGATENERETCKIFLKFNSDQQLL